MDGLAYVSCTGIKLKSFGSTSCWRYLNIDPTDTGGIR
jgi:hypothetical protein